MKQRIYNGHSLDFFDSSNNHKAEIKISGSDLILNPIDATGTVIIGEAGSINDIEIGAVGTAVELNFLGGGTITSNGSTLVIGASGDTVDLSNTTLGPVSASFFTGSFVGDGSDLINVVPDLSSYSGNIGVTGDLTISGNFNITGDINSTSVTDLDVTDKTITVGKGQTEANSGGSGIIVDGSAASLLWNESNNQWDFNKGLRVSTGTSGDAVLTIEADTDNNDENDNARIEFKQDGGTLYAKIGLTGDGGNTDFSNSIINAAYFGTTGDTPLQFFQNGAAQITIEIGGNVGIGTNNPTRKLDVKSTSSYVAVLNSTQTNSFLSFADANTSSNTFVAIGSETGDLIFRAGNTERARITTDGSVGIGTTSPSRKLHIHEASGNAYLQLTQGSTGTTNSDGFQIAMGASQVNFINRENGNMVFETNNTERMRIKSDGNVGIGTNNPDVKLHIVDTTTMTSGQSSIEVLKLQRLNSSGDIKASTEGHISMWATDSNNNNEWARISWVNDNDNDGGNENEGALSFWTNTNGTLNRAMYINHDQKVGIGTTTPDEKLHVQGGNVLISGSSADTTLKVQDGATGAPITLRSNGSGEAFLLLSTNSSIQRTGGDLNFFANGIDMKFSTNNGSTSTLFLDTSHNATFAGNVQINTPSNNSVGNGIVLNRPSAGTHYHGLHLSTDGTCNWAIGQNNNDSFQIYEEGLNSQTRFSIAQGGDATFSGRILSSYTGTSHHELKNATSNGEVLRLISTADSRQLTLQTDHIFSNGTIFFGTTSHATRFRGNSYDFATGDATFAGSVITTDGADTATLSKSGLTLNRSNSYIQSDTDNQDTLNIGQSSVRWGHVKVDSATFKVLNGGNQRFEINSSGNATFNGTVTTTGGLTVGDSNADTAQIGLKHLLGYCENTDVDTGTEDVKSLAKTTYQAVFFDYLVKNGNNMRAGTLTAVHDGTTVKFNEVSTVDVGTTTDTKLQVIIDGSNLKLQAVTLSDNWTVKANIRGIKV